MVSKYFNLQNPTVTIIREHNYKQGNVVNIQFYTAVASGLNNTSVCVNVPSDYAPSKYFEYIPCGTAFISATPNVGQCIPIYAGMTTDGKLRLVNDFGVIMYGVQVNFSYIV